MDFSAFIQSKEMEIVTLKERITALQKEVETYKALHNQVDYVKNQIKDLMIKIQDHPESVQESIILSLAGELGLSAVEIPFKNELEVKPEIITEPTREIKPEPTREIKPEPALEITTEPTLGITTEVKPETKTEVKPETATDVPEKPKRQSQAGFDARVKKWIKKLNSSSITEDELSVIETEIGYWDKFPVTSELMAALDAAKKLLYPSQSEDNEIEDEVEDDGIEVEEIPQLEDSSVEVENKIEAEDNIIGVEEVDESEVEADYLLKLNDDGLTESELNTIWTEIEGHYGDNIPQSLKAADRVAWSRLDKEDNDLGYEDHEDINEDNETVTLQEDVQEDVQQEDEDTTERDNDSWVVVLNNISDIATFKQWEEWINQEMERNPDGILPITIDALESARMRVFITNKGSQVSLFKTRLENAKTLEEHQEVCNAIRDSGIVEVSLIQTLEATRDALKAQKETTKRRNRKVRVSNTVEVTGDTVVETETKPVIAIGGIDTDENSITIRDFTGTPVTLKRQSDDYIFPIGTKLYDTVMDQAYVVCDWDELEIIHSHVNRDGAKVPVISLFDERIYLTINSLEKTVLLSDKEADQLVAEYKKKVQAMVETGDVF